MVTPIETGPEIPRQRLSCLSNILSRSIVLFLTTYFEDYWENITLNFYLTKCTLAAHIINVTLSFYIFIQTKISLNATSY